MTKILAIIFIILGVGTLMSLPDVLKKPKTERLKSGCIKILLFVIFAILASLMISLEVGK